ncbi:MAG: hypothetical protein ACON35_01880 [Candidatus Marinamargulisbacteria bacterium]
MKKFILLIALLSSTLFGLDFKDNAFKLNLKYDETIWESQPTEKYRERLILRHSNLPVTINVLAYRFAETITANGLVQRRIQSVYDGWQLLSEQDILTIQAKALNITEGRRSIYRKAVLEETLGQVHYFAGDICFVTDDTLAIVLNIEVQGANNLIRVKDEFNQIYTSFWYGDQKPILNYVINSSDNWVNQNQDLARRRYLDTDFQLSNSTVVSRKVTVDQSLSFRNPQFFSNGNGDYILDDQKMVFLPPNTDQLRWTELGLIRPKVQLTNDGFLAFQLQPFVQIKKLNLDLQSQMYYQENNKALDAFYVNNNVVLLMPDGVKLVNNKEELWKIDLPLNEMIHAADLETLIILDNKAQQLSRVNLNSGQIELSRALSDIESSIATDVLDMAISQGKLLLATKNKDDVTLSILDLDSLNIEDQATKNVKEFKIVSITDNLLIIQYKNLLNETMIEALDINTFASAWAQPFDATSPIITNNQLFYLNSENQLVSFKLNSNDPVTQLAVQDLLYQQSTTSENVTSVDAEFIRVFPKKSALMTIISHNSQPEILYLR